MVNVNLRLVLPIQNLTEVKIISQEIAEDEICRAYNGLYQQETPQKVTQVQRKVVEPWVDMMKTNEEIVMRSVPQMENIKE